MEDAGPDSIPKILHYIWVGDQDTSVLVKRCIESWKQYAPDYQIRFWNEKNAPTEHPYVRAMYEKKKWAFVSDYIRFWALEQEGGIYLDTDMELLQPLDSFLEKEAFVGRSNSGDIESSIIGSVAHSPFLKKALTFYDEDTEFSTKNTSPRVIERILASGDFPEVVVYGPEYFHPCDDGVPCKADVLEKAYARHHWAESWVSYSSTRKLLRRLGVMKYIKNVLRRS